MKFDILPLGNTFNELFTGTAVLGFIGIGLINAVLMLLLGYRYLQVIQQCGYNGYEYRKWIFRKDNTHLNRLVMLTQMSLLGFLLTNMAFSVFNAWWVSYTGFILYAIFLVVYLSVEFKYKNKLPLVLTKRMLRLILTYVVLTVVLSLLSIFLVNGITLLLPEYHLFTNFRYSILCVFPVLVPFTVLLAYYITKPLENAINKQFVLKATKTLAEKQNLIKIAVTGSYGKTTVKEVLKQMLSVKYKTYATPESYNTPLGIAKSINNLTDGVEVFIAEMGARHVGDIKELALIVNPNIAVITGVTGQHLETFLTINNVKKTKYELIENMQGGKAYFSSDNSYAYEMYKECPFEKYIAGLDVTYNPVVYATDVEVTESGTNFTINYCNKKIACKTGLLGKHNVSDICLAASVALGLGVSLSQIAEVVCNVKPIKHRLELTVNDAGVKILDDGYNANPDGVNRALEVLKVFSGKKVVVTPGIVELGIYESERNYEFGANMATVANEVILVGRGSALKIREGLISAEFSTDNVYMVKDLEGAKEKLQEIVTSGDTVLFINDLPDKYN